MRKVLNIDDLPDSYLMPEMVGMTGDVPPNTIRYFYKYGRGDPMTYYHPLGKYKSIDEVYGECLRRGCTWRELLNYKDPPEGTLI